MMGNVVRVVAAGMALLVLDIDHFKRINDGWGHPADAAAALRAAERLRQACTMPRCPGRRGPLSGVADPVSAAG